ncbi:MAG: hypothetical protein IT389_15425 [Nitrospira sp.]|nr:hypothetical protein [Nitrospira sp.]
MEQPRLHDGLLEGLHVKADKSATLCLKDVGGVQYELKLDSVEYLLANEFREGNIILDLTIERGKDCNGSLLRALFDSNYLKNHPEFLDALQRRIETEDLALVSIDPSYGCSFLALCRTINWRVMTSG